MRSSKFLDVFQNRGFGSLFFFFSTQNKLWFRCTHRLWKTFFVFNWTSRASVKVKSDRRVVLSFLKIFLQTDKNSQFFEEKTTSLFFSKYFYFFRFFYFFSFFFLCILCIIFFSAVCIFIQIIQQFNKMLLHQ